MALLERIRRLLGTRQDEGHRLVRADLAFTLMRLDASLGVHVPSGERPKTWYLEVADDAPAAVEATLREVFRKHNDGFRRAEPGDPNHLALVSFRQASARFDPRGPHEWESRAEIVWEASTCYVVDRPDRIVPVLPAGFTTHLLLRGLAEDRVSADDFRSLAPARFGGDRDLVEKILAAPGSFLALGLDMAEAAAGWR